MGKTYLGLNGLFTNILNILSFAELGIGTSIVYSLYKPLSEKDKRKISSLMNFFRKAYNVIGILIGILGLSIIPIMPYLIRDYSELHNVIYYYLLYLINSVGSYFFTYKRSLLIADQKEYISAINQFIFTFIQIIFQAISLLFLHSYSIYLWIAIFCTIFSNILISNKVNVQYPFLKDYTNESISKFELKKIKKNIFGLIGSKLGSIIVRSTDNVLLSAFLGIKVVGMYSNYLLIVTSISSIINRFLSSVTSSIGNLIIESNTQHSLKVFKIHFMINLFIVGITSGCLLTSLNLFIQFWAGSLYCLDRKTVLIIVINFYIDQLRQTSITFASAYGLFVSNGKKSIIEAILNLLLSIYFLRYLHLGISGVLLGTIITNILLNSWIEPLIIYKYGFQLKNTFLNFYIYTYLFNSLIVFVAILIINFLIKFNDTFLHFSPLVLSILNSIQMVIYISIFLFLRYHKNDGYIYIKKILYSLVDFKR